jgi:SSS family solute:Na+ symporter
MASILCAIAATIVTMRVTHNLGVGFLSPQAIGIATATIVMFAFRAFHPGRAQNNLAFAGGTDSR